MLHTEKHASPETPLATTLFSSFRADSKTDVTRAILSRDFVARVRDLYRATKSQTVRLSSCTRRLCHINEHGFCATFPVSRSCFLNTVPKWWNCSISNLFWTLRLIVRFRFARQPTKTKLLPGILSSVLLVWSVYGTKSQRATAQSHAATLSRDKIARVTSV